LALSRSQLILTHSCLIPCSLFAKITRNVDTFVEPRLSVIQHRRDAATRYNTLFLHPYALVLPKSHIIYTSGFLSFSFPSKRIVFTRRDTETSLALSQARGRDERASITDLSSILASFAIARRARYNVKLRARHAIVDSRFETAATI